ncbi:MAG TPA: hypothetical protein VF173_08875 [Thermoanaerobaculia bacterium]|nr:hypothetical protein [Thermoanaerobaculia bacterium]
MLVRKVARQLGGRLVERRAQAGFWDHPGTGRPRTFAGVLDAVAEGREEATAAEGVT